MVKGGYRSGVRSLEFLDKIKSGTSFTLAKSKQCPETYHRMVMKSSVINC